jgi:sterol desaturase/sphingolipid hydroxylase (fatty acid hydroxylase superfamily)
MHDYHHSHRKGCYGALFMDRLMGTDKDFIDFQAAKAKGKKA